MTAPTASRGSSTRRPLAAALALLLALACLAAGLSVAEAKPSSKLGKPRPISLLYALDAAGGTLRAHGKGAYRLTLEDPARSAVWFSDRPQRRSGSFPSEGLVEGWRGFGFAADPPNAALVFDDAGGREHTVVLELSAPRSAKGPISFTARPVGGSAVGPNLKRHSEAAEPPSSRRFEAATLFIDDAEAINLDGCIFQPYSECGALVYENAFFLEGIDFHGGTLISSELKRANLNHANFSAATISETSFENAQLKEANFEGASAVRLALGETNLEGANLKGADLSTAFLLEANLERTNFEDADLSGAELQLADLAESNLRGADLSGVHLPEATFFNTVMPDGSRCSSQGAQGCSLTK